MPRIRTIKPEFWSDEKVGEMSRDARLLFIGMWNFADDDGRIGGNPRVLRGLLFPFDDDADIPAWLEELVRIGVVMRYRVGRKPYLQVVNFPKHQKIDKRSKSFIPGPESADPAEQSEEPPEPSAGFGGDRRELGVGSQPQSQPQPQPQSYVAAPADQKPSEPPKTLPRTVEAPTSPPELWTGEEFFAWAQSKRQAVGLVPEGRPIDLGTWWSAALMTPGISAKAMKRAFNAFGQDKFWESQAPPFPFRAFMKQWDRYHRPKEAPRAASG